MTALKNEIERIIKEQFPEIGEFQLEEREVYKANCVLKGLTLVVEKGNNICPTVYPPATYDPGIAKKLAYALVDGVKKTDISEDIKAIRDFEKSREKILSFAVNTAKNQEYLANRPYINRGELAECFYLPYEEKEIGKGIIVVSTPMMKEWGVTPEILHACAEENTKRELVIAPLASALEAMGVEMEMTPPPVMVVTNRNKTNGGGTIFFPHLLREKLGTEDEYYIIPSSIHEILLFPKQETEENDVELEKDHLKKMIYEVNRTALAPEEFLSDNLFFLEGDNLSDIGCYQP